MAAELPHRLPQVGFRFGAEDFDGFALATGIRVEEAEPGPPGSIRSVPNDEAEQNDLTVETKGIELVLNGLPGVPGRGAHCLQGHQGRVPAGLAKDTWRAELDNSISYPLSADGFSLFEPPAVAAAPSPSDS
jgi:hypothetical protein